MEIKRVVLVLADISGYTRFIKVHTMSLLHAEAIIAELLEAVIDRAEHPLTLSKLEGDAAFLYAVLDGDEVEAARDILRQVTGFFDAFRARERSLIACDACQCDACSSLPQLKLKAFLHVGQAAFRTVRQFTELGGEDAILIHRLLKNTIPAKEYIALTESFYELSGGFPDRDAEARTEDCEGIGLVRLRVYYPEEPAALPARPIPHPPTAGTEYGDLADRWNRYAVERILGRVPQPNYAHLPPAKLSRWSLVEYFIVGVANNVLSSIPQWLGRKPRQ